MASLAVHIANMRAFKEIFKVSLEDASLKEGSIEHFFGDEFRTEAGGTFYRHLEEIAALLPDQEELVRATEAKKREVEATMPTLREMYAQHERLKAGNASLADMIGILENLLPRV